MEVWCSNVEMSGGGGGGPQVDADGDSRYEIAYVWDADGDGSSHTVCAGDADPFPQCRFSGDLIYPDFADDVNCMIPAWDGSPKCGNTYTMAMDGVIQLREGYRYINFPCWDISIWSADSNTPGAAPADAVASDPRNPSSRNSTSDTAFSHCPVDEFSSELFSVQMATWQGTIRGTGHDSRTIDEIVAAAEPIIGSEISDDRGNTYDPWFGLAEFSRGIQMGLVPSDDGDGELGQGASSAFHPSSDSKGWWDVVDSGRHNGTNFFLFGSGTFNPDDYAASSLDGFCICNHDSNCDNESGRMSGADVNSLNDGDIVSLFFEISEPSTRWISTELIVTKPSGGFPACTTTHPDSVFVQFGFKESLSSDVHMFHPMVHSMRGTYDFTTASRDATIGKMYIGHPRSGYLDAAGRLENLTIRPQDPWNSAASDCATTGEYERDTPSTDTDDDCDTNPHVGLAGGGRHGLKDVLFNEHTGYALDGFVHGVGATVEDVTWRNGFSGPVADPGYGWDMDGIRVDSLRRPSGSIFAAFQTDFVLRNARIANSTFEFISELGSGSSGGVEHNNVFIENIRMESVNAEGAFRIVCGTIQSTLKNIHGSGRKGPTGGPILPFIYLTCASASNPIEGNYFSDIWEENGGLDSASTSNVGQPIFIVNDATGGGVIGNVIDGVRNLDPDDLANSIVAFQASMDQADMEAFIRGNTVSNSYVAAASGVLFADCPSSSDCDNGPPTGMTAETLGSGNMVGGEPQIGSGASHAFVSDASGSGNWDTGTEVCAALGNRTCDVVRDAFGNLVASGCSANTNVTNGELFYAICGAP